ncbi:MAG: hypothetical protein GYA36_23050 [Veillonellaceae bacterium]|nr:hypothetical protein [Veillonellaceae bacterium]
MPRAKPPKPPEPAKGKAAKVPASAPEGPATSARSNPLPEWAMQAYTAHVGRGQPINALAREFGLDWSTVKRNIEKVHLAVCAAENSDTVDARAKHEARLREVLKCLWQDYTRADNQATRAQLLKSIADVSEKLAACQGVVTQRAAHEVTGKDGGPVQVDHGSEAIESLTRAIASIAARSQQERGNSQSDAGTGEGASD